MAFIKDLLLWIYWYPFKTFIQKIPAKYVYLISRIMGTFLYHVANNKRSKLERELIFIFGNKLCDKKKGEFVKEAFRILMYNKLEVLLFPILNENNISSFATCSGLENLDSALSRGKGAMLLFAHFGANQMIMPAIGYNGYEMSQLSAPAVVWIDKLPNKKFTKIGIKILETQWKHELSLPVTHVSIFGSLKKAFLCLKRNEVLGVAMDGGGGRNSVLVDFLGKKALFYTGSIEIAMRTGCTVLPTFMIRNKSGVNELIIEPPLKILRSDDENATIKNIRLFIAILARYVSKYPDHYLNFLALRRFMAEQGDDPFFIKGIQT
jgi:lauroyl/myristoyl acyltransferase